MGFNSKGKSNSEGWGMGFLLVFFPEEDQNQQQETKKKTHNFNLFSSSSSPISFSRTSSNHLLHKAQSTISICLLLFFTTLLLFTLSALPSSTTTAATGGTRRIYNYNIPRRQLGSRVNKFASPASNLSYALQGMGTLYRRGTIAMSELVVAHAVESLTLHDFKIFIRLLYRSGLTSISDLLILFPSKRADFDNVILQENDSFLKLVTQYTEKLGNTSSPSERAGFDVTQFVKMSKKEKESGDPIWGRRIRGNFSEGETGSAQVSFGSVVGFDVEELDPENSLSGFLDHVPMSLRRWASYPMLLGRLRRNFKHIMLVDMKEILVLGDQLGRVRSQSLESVLLTVTTQSPGKHGKKNSDKTQLIRQKPVNPGIILGGTRGVRRLSNAMLTDIVRAAMQHKKKNSVSETSLLNQLAGNEFVLKNVKLIVSSKSVPELSSLVGSHSKSGSHLFMENHTVIRRGNSNLDVSGMVMKHICSFPLDSKVYSDC